MLVAMNRLRAEDNFIWLQGALVELLTVATQTLKQYSGYLLTSRRDPATASEIGRMLRVDGRGVHASALAVLGTLSKAGLLEEVAWCPVDHSGNIVDEVTPPLKDVTMSKGGAGPAKKPRSRPKKEGKPFKEKSKVKEKRKNNLEGQAEAKRRTENALAPTGRVRELEPRRQGESDAQFYERRKQELLTQLQADSALAPPTTPPIPETPIVSPTNPDAGGLCRERGSRKAPHVFISHGCDPQGQRTIKLHRLDPERYSAEAWRVADQVLDAVGYVARSGPDSANERATWAAAWDEAVAVVYPSRLEFFRRKLLAKARYVCGRRDKYSRPEAYLRTAFDNLVRDFKRTEKGAIA